MTKKNPDITSAPAVVSFVSDWQVYQSFKEMVGDQNVSKELRAMIKDRVAQEKNEQALERTIDPLGLSNLTQSRDNHTRQSTLFETFASRDRRDEIHKFVHSVKETAMLNTIETNCKAMLGVAKVRREKLVYSRL